MMLKMYIPYQKFDFMRISVLQDLRKIKKKSTMLKMSKTQ